jgi:cytochrome c oxidase assembly factor CtaG
MWTFPWMLTLALAAIAVVYLWRRRQLPGSRVAAFLGGIATVWLAIGSPIATLDHELLTFHMVKHLLLMTVAAPLILMGTTHSRSWSGRWMALCWLAGTCTVIGWHIPATFQLALGSQAWHNVENASFLLAGLLFWLPIVETRATETTQRQWSAPVYLFLATMPCDVLSAFLVFCGRVVYPSYLTAPRRFSLSPLEDQEFAGALMWVAVTFIYLAPATLITLRILSPRGEHSHLHVSA